MRLDPTYLTYITKEEMRVLLAVEMGMRNHEFVPVHLIEKIAHQGRSCTYTYLKLLLKNKLVYHQRKQYDGYKLTYLGYDYLALHVFMKRGVVKDIIGKIGVGKESDIYKCTNEDGEEVVLKFARLGRVSFKTVKNNRDYIQGRTQYNWLYLSRLQAVKEYTFMELLHQNGFPTPTPYSQNRHGIVMSLADGKPLTQVKAIGNPEKVHKDMIDLIIQLGEHGLIHSDFNEFNLLINSNYKITMIDFPQMVSTKHPNADDYFQRDVDCVHRYFEKKMKFVSNYTIELKDINTLKDLDQEARASGYLKKELKGKAGDLDILDQVLQCDESDSEGFDDGLLDDSDDQQEEEQDEQQDNSQDDDQEEQKEEQQNNDEQDDFEDLLNEEGDYNDNDNKFQEFEGSFDDGEEEQQEQQEQELDSEEEEKRQKRQMRKERKKEKQAKKGDSNKLREQLLQKIKMDEERKLMEQKKEEERYARRQLKVQQKLERQQQNRDMPDSESEEEESDEYDEEQEQQMHITGELKEKVSKHISQQVSKKFKTKFKIQKFTKRGQKDVKDSHDFYIQ